MMPDLHDTLKRARDLSWERFGKRISFFLPGMFSYNGLSGRYPAVSITGDQCALQCDHCQGKILKPMIKAPTPRELVRHCLRLEENGNHGILISGGCDEEGRLPWHDFIPAIEEVKGRTGLYISIHCGLVDDETAAQLKNAGVDQALIDVIGDDETYRDIYHVPFGVSRIFSSLKALDKAHLPVVPHIVCGLHYGKMRGEWKALEMISLFPVGQVVLVSLMRIRGTPGWDTIPLEVEEIVRLMAETRFRMPEAQISLGCARERGNTRLETLSIEAGVNRMALPSEEAIRLATDFGLDIRYQRTCCSVSADFSNKEW
jgi:uncharacterized radical SAM superfamily protein